MIGQTQGGETSVERSSCFKIEWPRKEEGEKTRHDERTHRHFNRIKNGREVCQEGEWRHTHTTTKSSHESMAEWMDGRPSEEGGNDGSTTEGRLTHRMTDGWSWKAHGHTHTQTLAHFTKMLIIVLAQEDMNLFLEL